MTTATEGPDKLQRLEKSEPPPAVEVEKPAKDTAQTDQQQDSDKDVDWKARFETETARVQKLEGDLKAQVGRRGSGRQRDAELKEMQRTMVAVQAEQGSTNEIIKALSKHLAAGTTDQLPAEVAQAEQRAHQTAAARAYSDGYSALRERILALGDSDLKVEEAPELREVLGRWDSEADRQERLGITERSLGGFADIYVDAAEKVSELRVKKAQEGFGAQRQEIEEAARKAALQEADVDDMFTGKSAAGSGSKPTLDNIDVEYMAGRVSEADYGAFLNTGKIQ